MCIRDSCVPAAKRSTADRAGRRSPRIPCGQAPTRRPGRQAPTRDTRRSPGACGGPGTRPAGTMRNHQGEDCPRNSGGVFHERRGAVWPRWRDRPDSRPPIPHSRRAGGHPACPGAHPGRAETPGVEPAPTPGIPGRQADTLRAQALTRTCGNPCRASAHPRDTRPAGGHPARPGAHPGRAETPGVEPAPTPGITGAGDCPRDGGAVCADTLGAQSGLGGGIASGCW